ncbi:MAG: response regulator [Bdellovibrionales bacterium]
MKPQKIQILLVDDEISLLETIAELFRTFNLNVDTATDGDSAWDLYQKNQYDLVITDMRMPNGDGIDLAKKIKTQSDRKTCLLFISGFTEASHEEIYSLGAEGIFAKPFEASAVKKAMHICLLKPENKWSAEKPEKIDLHIEKTAESLDSLEVNQSMLFGRGGFFVSQKSNQPKINSYVSFHLKLTNSPLSDLEGCGIVRWVSPGKGFGVEILTLNSESAREYAQRFETRVPFIPKAI